MYVTSSITAPLYLYAEEKEITFTIKPEDLQFFDDRKHEWVAEPGKFKAYISSSSADTQNIVEFEYK